MYNDNKSFHWYVAYTFPNAEKSIQRSLCKMEIDSFLPLRTEIRKWSDRKKSVTLPLFPGYIFIYSSHTRRYEALAVKGIIKYVSFDGKPAIMSNEQIESIKKIMPGEVQVHENADLKTGDRIRIMEGPFIGAEGVLQKVNGSMRLFVQIECLNRSVSVNIPNYMVSLIGRSQVA